MMMYIMDINQYALNRAFDRSKYKGSRQNTERLQLERNMVNNYDIKHEGEPAYERQSPKSVDVNKFKKFGEITGESISPNDYDMGMPLRSKYTTKRNDKANGESRDPTYDIYNDDRPLASVNNFDPLRDSVYNINSDTMLSVIPEHNPIHMIANNMNDFAYFYWDNLSTLMPSGLFNSLGLYNAFAGLYMLSTNITKQELENYYKFIDKSDLYTGLREIHNMTKSRSYLCRDFICFNKRMISNNNALARIRDIINVIPIDTTNPQGEATRVNTMINNIFNNQFGTVIKPDYIANMSITIFNIGMIVPVFAEPLDKITYRGSDYLKTIRNVSYYESDTYQAIELPLSDNQLVMGVVTPNKSGHITVELSDITEIVNNMQHRVVDIAIPCMRHNAKLRHIRVLQESGLREIFNNTELGEMTSTAGVINDVMQNIIIDVNNRSLAKYAKKYNTPTNQLHVVKPSYYYMRVVPINMIIAMWKY